VDLFGDGFAEVGVFETCVTVARFLGDVVLMAVFFAGDGFDARFAGAFFLGEVSAFFFMWSLPLQSCPNIHASLASDAGNPSGSSEAGRITGFGRGGNELVAVVALRIEIHSGRTSRHVTGELLSVDMNHVVGSIRRNAKRRKSGPSPVLINRL
jgi:hypothetical protein